MYRSARYWDRELVELDLEFKVGDPIWQGDLVGFRGWGGEPPLRRFGVIITADCDIQWGPPDQDLVFLRVLAQTDYIDLFWSRTKLEGVRDKTLVDLTQMINRLRRTSDPAAGDLKSSDVEGWLYSENTGVIVNAIQISSNKDQERLVKTIDNAKTILDLFPLPARTPCLDRLMQSRHQTRSQVLKQASTELAKIRDELFFLTGIIEPTDERGYYVLLDHIGVVKKDQITDSMAEMRQGKKPAYRFGRLARTYKYALAQRFAYLFQRIGLPNEHAESHIRTLSLLNSDATPT